MGDETVIVDRRRNSDDFVKHNGVSLQIILSAVALIVTIGISIGGVYMNLNNGLIRAEEKVERLTQDLKDTVERNNKRDDKIDLMFEKISAIHSEITTVVSTQSATVNMLNGRIKTLEKGRKND